MDLAAAQHESFQQAAQGFLDGLIAVLKPLLTTTVPVPVLFVGLACFIAVLAVKK